MDNTSTGALFAIYSGEQFVQLVQFSHPNLVTPLYYCDDNQDIVSNGNTYKATGLEVSIPVEDMTRAPSGAITIDNTKLDMTAMVNQCSGGIGGQAITVTTSIVRKANPNSVLVGPIAMEMRQPKITEQSLNSSLENEECLDETNPGDTMTPYTTPGEFTASWYSQV